MAIVTNTLNYLDGDTLLEGFFAFDDAIVGQRPAVIVSHAWAGRSEFTSEKAIKLIKYDRVNFIATADYSEGKQIDILVKGIIDKVAGDCEC